MRKHLALAALLIVAGCSGSTTDLHGTWVTDLGPLGHDGYSHSTFNSDGTYALDMEFVVAGSDCFLDVTTTGTYEADATTLTITHVSGTQAVSRCSDETLHHDERAMTPEEIEGFNITGELMWDIDGEVLTLTDESDLTRIYARLSEE